MMGKGGRAGPEPSGKRELEGIQAMAKFTYQARDEQFGFSDGEVAAGSAEEAAEKVRAEGLTPLWVWPKWELTSGAQSNQIANYRLVRDDGVKLEYATSRGIAVAGIAIAAVGGVLVFVCWRGSGGWLESAFAVPFLLVGAVIALAGVAMILWRSRLAVDQVTKELTKRSWIGPVRLKDSTIRGAEFARVVFSAREETERSGPQNTRTTTRLFVTALEGKDGPVEEVDASSAARLQYEMAFKIADYLDLPFVIEPEVEHRDKTSKGRTAPEAGGGKC